MLVHLLCGNIKQVSAGMARLSWARWCNSGLWGHSHSPS